MAITQPDFTKHFAAPRILLPVLLGLSVIAYMLYKNYEPAHLQTLFSASIFWLLITLLVLVVRDLGYMYRIRFITDKALSWKQSFKVIMIWEFASCALPSVVGGSTIAAYILFKEKITLGKAVAQVMVTAMLDNLYFVIAFPLILLFTGGQVLPEMAGLNQTLRESIGIAFFASYLMIAGYASTMFYALFINPKGVKRMLLRLGQLKPFRRWRTPLFQHANELLIASKHLRTKSSAYWVHASISTLFVWTARYAIIGCLIAAFTNLSLYDHVLVFSRNLVYKIVLFLSVTPGGAGMAEISFPAFFGAFLGGFTTVVVLLYRILTYYVYLIAGALIFPEWAASKLITNKRSDVGVAGDKPVGNTQPVLPAA